MELERKRGEKWLKGRSLILKGLKRDKSVIDHYISMNMKHVN